MRKNRFTKRVRSGEKNADTTWINTRPVRRSNSVMIELYAYGESVFQPGYRGAPLPLACWAVEYVCEGILKIEGGGESFLLRKGDVLILYPGRSYARSALGDAPVVKREIMLNNSPLISILCNRSNLNGRNVVHCTDPAAVETRFNTLRELVSTPSGGDFPERQLCNTVFAVFTELIFQCRRAENHGSFNELLSSLDIYSPDLSLEGMAAHFNVEKRTLNRIFNKHFGSSPIRYLISYRMKYASLLLRNNSLPVRAVAEECGYRSPSFFCAEFKKYFGRTPLEYRNKPDLSG